MTELDELRARIENATRSVKEDYERTLEIVVTLKEKMNELEQRISQKKPEAKEDEFFGICNEES